MWVYMCTAGEGILFTVRSGTDKEGWNMLIHISGCCVINWFLINYDAVKKIKYVILRVKNKNEQVNV